MDSFLERCEFNLQILNIKNFKDIIVNLKNKEKKIFSLVNAICKQLVKIEDEVDQYEYDQKLYHMIMDKKYNSIILYSFLNEIKKWSKLNSIDIKGSYPYRFEPKYEWVPLQSAYSKFILCKIDSGLMSSYIFAANSLYSKLRSLDSDHGMIFASMNTSRCNIITNKNILDMIWDKFQRELDKNIPNLDKCLDLYHTYTYHYKNTT